MGFIGALRISDLALVLHLLRPGPSGTGSHRALPPWTDVAPDLGHRAAADLSIASIQQACSAIPYLRTTEGCRKAVTPVRHPIVVNDNMNSRNRAAAK